MLDLSLLQALIHTSLNLLAESIHLVRLFLYQSRLGCHYLFMSLLHVSLTFLLFHLLSLNLNLVSLCVLLLAGELTLNRLEIKKFGAQLESQRELLLKYLPVLLEIMNVTLLQSTDCLLILSLHLLEGLIPALVEVLVLHQVCLLDLFPLSGLIEDELLTATIEVLHLQLLDAVLRHLGFHVLALHLTLFAMLLKYGSKQTSRS